MVIKKSIFWLFGYYWLLANTLSNHATDNASVLDLHQKVTMRPVPRFVAWKEPLSQYCRMLLDISATKIKHYNRNITFFYAK